MGLESTSVNISEIPLAHATEQNEIPLTHSHIFVHSPLRDETGVIQVGLPTDSYNPISAEPVYSCWQVSKWPLDVLRFCHMSVMAHLSRTVLGNILITLDPVNSITRDKRDSRNAIHLFCFEE